MEQEWPHPSQPPSDPVLDSTDESWLSAGHSSEAQSNVGVELPTLNGSLPHIDEQASEERQSFLQKQVNKEVSTVMEHPSSSSILPSDVATTRKESFSRSRDSVGLSLDGTALAQAIEDPDAGWPASADAQEQHVFDQHQNDNEASSQPPASSETIDNDSSLTQSVETPEAYERAGAFDAFDSAESYEPDWLGVTDNQSQSQPTSDIRDSLMVDPSNPAMAAIQDVKTPDVLQNDAFLSGTTQGEDGTDEAKLGPEQPAEEEGDSWASLLGDTGHTEDTAAPVGSVSELPLLSNTAEELQTDPISNVPKPEETSWDDAFKDEDETDDLWSKALGSEKPKAEGTWENLFDDEDFLDDTQLEASQPQVSAASYATEIPRQALPEQTSLYGAAPPIHQQPQAPPQNQGSGGGMKFFEELPMTQTIRRGRPRPPIPSTSPIPSQGAPPPPSANQGPVPPPRQSSASGHTPYGKFQPPEKLDLFPQQATVPSIPTPPSSNYAPTPHQKPPPPPNTRYSPAQPQPGAAAKYAAAPPTQSSRYGASPSYPPQANAQHATMPPIPDPSSIPSATTNSFIPPQQPPPSRDSATSPPTAAMRYSPGPSQASPLSPPRSKPPPAPSNDREISPLPPPPVNRFAPRTSSPLAHQDHRSSSNSTRPLIDQIPDMRPTQATVTESSTNRASPPPPPGKIAQRYSPALSSSAPMNGSNQVQAKTVSYTSQDQQSASGDGNGPPRPRTQSPENSRTKFTPSLPTVDRPASAQDGKPPPVRYNRAPARKQSLSANLDFVVPEDEQASDPLQRWKGSPVFRWNAGGAICTTFPQRVPRYGGGQAAPMLKCMPGEVKLQPTKDIAPIEDILVSFPGPLKSKNKKKDALNWLSTRIQTLEVEVQSTRLNLTSDMATQARLEEKLLLWQILRIFIEHDGVLTGNPTVDSATRDLLAQSSPAQSSTADPTESSPVESQSEPLKPGVTDEIRQNLLRGEREKAVWHAADNRMWGHAMLISSTLDQNLHKQLVQEFVRKEVRNKGQSNQSLAALYEVLAGNWDESIDELVPASARAGFQMMSTAESVAQRQDALHGLTKWRETLGLILSNRRPEDEQGILSLGKLLAGYGRVEAAHTCFLFARSIARLGGADDTQANFTLLGADVQDPTFEAGHDLESILLSEVYEFALSLIPSASAYYIPHLQAYKLHHAYILAECGRTSDALQYCEAIATATKSMTRGSPYYHATLTAQVDDLFKRLSQSHKDSGSGWISKPSIEKVSGSMWAKFNSFVAGDEPDPNSAPGSGPQSDTEIGPFAGVQGGTPTISRSNSNFDLYANHNYPKRTTSYNANSRYAPLGPGAGTPEGDQGTYSPYAPVAPSAPSYGTPPSSSQSYQPSAFLSGQPPHGTSDHLEVGSQRSYGSSSYEPYVPSVPEEPAPSSFGQPAQITHGFNFNNTQQNDGYKPNGVAADDELTNSYSYEPSAGGYEPPTSSYQPYEPDNQPQSPETPAGPKSRKGIMEDDEDDDIVADAAALKAAEKARKDREADEAVRRAAEADAARDAQAAADKRSSGWLGGWFGGGKKDKEMPTVYKAKLGEENSFYYDSVAKKWVNKKDPGAGSASSAAPTPPPPKGLSRNTSGAATPPIGAGPPPGAKPPLSSTPPIGASPAITGDTDTGPPSRIATPASNAGSDVPPQAPKSGASALASGPPSRPATSMSNASSIDDLIGVPAARKGGTLKKGKRTSSRYVDVMGQGGGTGGS